MTDAQLDLLLILACLVPLAASWIGRIREDAEDKAAERGRRNMGRSQ